MSVKVRRANVVLRVEEEDVDYYKKLGYDILRDGGVVESAVPHDAAALQKLYLDAQAKVTELEAQVASLTQELELLKKAKKSTTAKKPKTEEVTE